MAMTTCTAGCRAGLALLFLLSLTAPVLADEAAPALVVAQAAPAAPPPASPYWNEFNAMRDSQGNVYRARRDALLADPATRERLTPFLIGNVDAFPWWDRAGARILTGWFQHRARYEQFIRELGAIDIDAEDESRDTLTRVWSVFAFRAQREYGPDIIPLAWESVWKFGADLPHWQVVLYMRVLESMPDALTPAVLIDLLGRTDDPAMQNSVRQSLTRLPADLVRPEVATAIGRHDSTSVRLLQLPPGLLPPDAPPPPAADPAPKN